MMRIKSTPAFLIVMVLALQYTDASRTSTPLLLAEGGFPGSQAVPAEAVPQQEVPVVDTKKDAEQFQPEPRVETPQEQQEQTPVEEELAPEPEPEPELVPEPESTPEPAAQPSSKH